MISQNNHPMLDDVLTALVTENDHPTAEMLEKWIALYPQFSRELVDFAAAWAEQELLPPAPPLAADVEKRLIDRAMSHVQNLTFGREAQADATDSGSEKNPIESLTGEAKSLGFNASDFAKGCGLDLMLMTKLNNRLIAVLSIPASLIRHIGRQLQRSPGAVRTYLASPPRAIAGKSFLARGKPEHVGQQETFAEAIRSSSLSDAEKARWLAESAELKES